MEIGILSAVAIMLVLGIILNRILRSLHISRSSYGMKYVLITGCDTGFGNITAKKLYQMGFNVFASCLTESGNQELLEFAKKENKPNQLTPFLMNVTSTESIKEGYKLVRDKIPPTKGLWGLINNAGVAGPFAGIEFFTKTDYQEVLDINALGMFDVTTQFLPLLKKAKGRIVNTSSVMGRIGFIGTAPYCVSKYAVEAFSDSARRQLKVWGVSVHVIEPSFFRTNICSVSGLEESCRETFSRAEKELVKYYGESFLLETLDGGFLAECVRNNNKNVHLVRDAYIHALTAVFPYVRYYVGLDAHYYYVPLSLLPGAIQDMIFPFWRKLPVPAAMKKK